MNFFGALSVLGLSFLFAAIFYEIGRWREREKLTWEFSENREEYFLDGYAKGRADADNWWIRQEEEVEKVTRQ